MKMNLVSEGQVLFADDILRLKLSQVDDTLDTYAFKIFLGIKSSPAAGDELSIDNYTLTAFEGEGYTNTGFGIDTPGGYKQALVDALNHHPALSLHLTASLNYDDSLILEHKISGNVNSLKVDDSSPQTIVEGISEVIAGSSSIAALQYSSLTTEIRFLKADYATLGTGFEGLEFNTIADKMNLFLSANETITLPKFKNLDLLLPPRFLPVLSNTITSQVNSVLWLKPVVKGSYLNEQGNRVAEYLNDLQPVGLCRGKSGLNIAEFIRQEPFADFRLPLQTRGFRYLLKGTSTPGLGLWLSSNLDMYSVDSLEYLLIGYTDIERIEVPIIAAALTSYSGLCYLSPLPTVISGYESIDEFTVLLRTTPEDVLIAEGSLKFKVLERGIHSPFVLGFVNDYGVLETLPFTADIRFESDENGRYKRTISTIMLPADDMESWLECLSVASVVYEVGLQDDSFTYTHIRILSAEIEYDSDALNAALTLKTENYGTDI